MSTASVVSSVCADCRGLGWIILRLRGPNGAVRCACGLRVDPPLPPRPMDRKAWEAWWGKNAKAPLETSDAAEPPVEAKP